MKYIIQYQDQFFTWRRYGESYSRIGAYNTAVQRTKTTKKRHRLVDKKGNLIDLIG